MHTPIIPPVVKRTLQVAGITVLAVLILFTAFNYPFGSAAKTLPPLADTAHLRNSLQLLINTPRPRNYKNPDVLDTVAERIRNEMSRYSARVSVQNFTAANRHYKNLLASFGPETGERLIVGAHYDVCGEQDGADDNASGVAGLLELARLLSLKAPAFRVDLVAYSLEEPPFFATENMGSFVHAKSVKDAGIAVKGMICLEMIGYYADGPGSQEYPLPPLQWVYGDKGNFATVVQNGFCGDFARQFKKALFANNSIDIKSFRAPSFFGGVNLSDQRNYWQMGYSAVMVTNTSFYRNKNYHLPGDQLPTLDLHRMGLTVETVYRSILSLQ